MWGKHLAPASKSRFQPVQRLPQNTGWKKKGRPLGAGLFNVY